MKVLMINSVCGIRSTGRICTDIATQLEQQGHEVKIAYGREQVPEKFRPMTVHIEATLDQKLHGLQTRFFDTHGFGSKRATRKFLRWAEEYDPDVLWLHNLHGYYLNVEMLFDWIKSRPQMQVKWTIHDCWAFTGHCAFFTMAGCEKWKTQCEHCVQKRGYPQSVLADNSKNNFERKRAAFSGVPNMTLYVVSEWLGNLVKQSFLGQYPIEVKYNEVNREVFKPTPSDFRAEHNLQDKKMVLGVASVWDARKGLNDILHLADTMDELYHFVLVGLSPKQIKALSSRKNVLPLGRTDSPQDLAAIYTAADVFVNPSKEETFGLTTVEALYCGTMPVVYKGTACEEIVGKYGGIAVGNVDEMRDAIRKVCAGEEQRG